MKLNEYQKKATETAIYGAGSKVVYPILGLVGEAGELANKYKKVLRDNNGIMSPEVRAAMSKELGDVLWYIAATANDLGTTLEEVAQENINKLKSRQFRGQIRGSGDDR